jgi:predicted HicB family RNase H-like nuclease
MKRILKTKSPTKQWSIRAATKIHDRLMEFADEQHVSLNYFTVTLLEAGLHQLEMEKQNGTDRTKK